MVQTLPATQATLADLRQDLGLQRTEDDQFFREWQDDLPTITDTEQQFLDKLRAGYLNLLEYLPFLERAVQVSILGPLLSLGNFYLPPFHVKTEESIEIITEDEGIVIRGQMDILLLKEQFWVMVIESKRITYSIEAGLAQLLAYMLANLHPDRPGFGLIATGAYIFLKVVKGDVTQYATSRPFLMRESGNTLYDVFRITKKIGQL
ncbi:MAG: restriction endonuclease subunit R [Thermosynechococcaceae cyanobacterium]